MSLNSRLQGLQSRKHDLEEEIANLEELANLCTKDIKKEQNAANKKQLSDQRQGYWDDIDQNYETIEEIEEKINELKYSSPELSLNNHQDNPQNQRNLNINGSLYNIDFEKALETFNKIQSQFNKEGDVALFFMEEHLIKRGDLCLQKLKNNLTPNTSNFYREHFRHCYVTYNSGNLDAVLQGIANFFGIKQQENTIELLIQKIGDSLHNNSVLFIEINCDISDASEIDPLILWFINDFWQPLQTKINEVIEDFDGIKVVAIIVSDILLNPRLSTEELSCYCHVPSNCFSRNKLIQIPLENWTKEDIANWLTNYANPSLKKRERNSIAKKIYNQTQGLPTAVCFALQQQWRTLIYPTNSC